MPGRWDEHFTQARKLIYVSSSYCKVKLISVCLMQKQPYNEWIRRNELPMTAAQTKPHNVHDTNTHCTLPTAYTMKSHVIWCKQQLQRRNHQQEKEEALHNSTLWPEEYQRLSHVRVATSLASNKLQSFQKTGYCVIWGQYLISTLSYNYIVEE